MIEPVYHSTRADGVRLFKRKSDLGVKIRKKGTDELYNDAIDVESSTDEYEETDVPVDVFPEEMEESV